MIEIDWGPEDELRINGQKDSCVGCRACCIVLEIPELDKPAGVLCKNLTKDGCGDYESRPQVCRDFVCDRTFGLVRIALIQEAGYSLPTAVDGKGSLINPLEVIQRRTY